MNSEMCREFALHELSLIIDVRVKAAKQITHLGPRRLNTWLITALHLRQKSIISSGPASGPASACARAVGAPHTDSQRLPVSELLVISTLATAKPRAEAEAEAEADSEHFDMFGTLQLIHVLRSPRVNTSCRIAMPEVGFSNRHLLII
jgi:hypothetical protein